MNIIAIVGLPGSGKSEVTKSFTDNGYERIYFGDITFDYMQEKGWSVSEANERKAREEIRRVHGMAGYAILSIPKIKEAALKGNVVVESMYSWDEYKILKETFGKTFRMVAVYAPAEVRYSRLSQRPKRPLTAVEAESRDHSQIENLKQAGPIAMADWTLVNQSSLEDLKQNTTKIIETLK